MSRHYDKLITGAREMVAEVGRPPERTEPRTRAEIESFVKGFGLSAAATRRIVDEWDADTARARSAGYDDARWDS
jgi:hypothetical protein